MKPLALIFVIAFACGALVALAARAARHDPYANPPPAPHAQPAPAPAETNPAPPAAVATTNTICPVCGMPVDPNLPTATYQGQKIGFGCRNCPPKFEAEPERYGPPALRNEEGN